jgi:hypothetical protein
MNQHSPFPQPQAPGAITSLNQAGSDAEALRQRRERAGKWSALLITVAIHAVAILVLTLIVLPAMQTDMLQIRPRYLPPSEITTATPVPARSTVRPKPAAVSAAARLISTHAATAAVFAPVRMVETSVADIGAGTGLGMGFGSRGIGDGQDGFDLLPPGLRGRCTQEERRKRLNEGGGTAACEAAVVKALRWLQANQNSDGSWGGQFKASMTGLALLAYLGHCETPRSTEFGQTVTRGLEFLINLGNRRDGRLSEIGGHAWVYEHAIATYALCEAHTFVKELEMEFPGLQDAGARAVGIILRGQHPSGFWDYDYNQTSSRPGDLSVTGWHVQALKAAHHAGFASRELDQAVDRALDRTAAVQAADGTFGYTGPAALGQRLTGVGVLSFQLWGRENHRAARDGLRWLHREMDPVYSAPTSNLYAWYYTTMALFQRGSAYWDRWNRQWRDEILNNQREDGSWKPEGNFAGGPAHLSTKAAGRDAEIYRVCLNTLSLEVYYRFLPGTGGGQP